MHPGSTEYSMPNGRVVNKFLDEGSWSLVELFDRGILTFEFIDRLLDPGGSSD